MFATEIHAVYALQSADPPERTTHRLEVDQLLDVPVEADDQQHMSQECGNTHAMPLQRRRYHYSDLVCTRFFKRLCEQEIVYEPSEANF